VCVGVRFMVSVGSGVGYWVVICGSGKYFSLGG
jgi:hypothetical protein